MQGGVVLRRFMRILLVAAVALLVAGCGLTANPFARDGVGTTLETPNIADTAALQTEYVRLICEAADLRPCDPGPAAAADWGVFVQAGMNDIDERCDKYLAWLDARRRDAAPALKQISDLSRAATGIMLPAGASKDAITIVGLAFGLATDTFTNVNSRLLFEINQSTVQTVVLRRQNEYRLGLPRLINNRPAAMHALRSYLRLCMPFTIETEIKTTVTLFERGGSRIDPLVTPRTVQAQVIRSPTVPLPPPRRAPVVNDGELRIGTVEKKLTGPQIKALKKIACIKPADERFTLATRNAILAFLRDKIGKDPAAPDMITPTDAANMRNAPASAGGC